MRAKIITKRFIMCPRGCGFSWSYTDDEILWELDGAKEESPDWPVAERLARAVFQTSTPRDLASVRLRPTVEQPGAWKIYAGGYGGIETRVYPEQIQKALS